MNPAALTLIKLGLDTLIQLWAIHANKPAGWKPSPEDWAALRAEVLASTPEAILNEAILNEAKLLTGRPTVTPE
jgi:hypothetical protein